MIPAASCGDAIIRFFFLIMFSVNLRFCHIFHKQLTSKKGSNLTVFTPDNREYLVGASITRQVKSLLRPLPGWIAVAVLLLLPGLLHAQQYSNPGIMQNPVLYTPQDYEGRYFKVGSFALRPLLNVAAEWHDNIYYQPHPALAKDNVCTNS